MARLLCAELHRIYTVMQTSKVYDLSGKKLVELEGYKPKFSFWELRTTDVDFNDSRWMLLSRFNKDLTFCLAQSVVSVCGGLDLTRN